MTITSSLNAGVSGLNANAARLATISENIANSSTFGYRRAFADFESVMVGGAPGSGSFTAGGVRSSASRLIDETGPLVGTGNALDIAVSGRGMLPVRSAVGAGVAGAEQSLILTRTGAFRPDAQGILRTESGLVLLGWPAGPDGTIPSFSRDSDLGLRPVRIDSSQRVGDPTTRIGLGINLPATSTMAGAPGSPLPFSVEYFDNLGTSQSLRMSFTPTVPATGASNSWMMQVRDSAQNDAIVGEYEIAFDGARGTGGALLSATALSGAAYDPAEGTVTVPVAGGPISLYIGRPGANDGLTQLDSSFAPSGISKDGSPIGTLTALEVDKGGYIIANYDTGFSRRLFQIPLVDVPNLNGLRALSDQTYQITPRSGAFTLWDAGTGPVGTVAGFAREGSATDVAAELTSLIQTQRAYASNAKVIQTVDEMLQETTNIKR